MTFVSKITSTTNNPERSSKLFYKKENSIVTTSFCVAIQLFHPLFECFPLAQRNTRIEKIFHASLR